MSYRWVVELSLLLKQLGSVLFILSNFKFTLLVNFYWEMRGVVFWDFCCLEVIEGEGQGSSRVVLVLLCVLGTYFEEVRAVETAVMGMETGISFYYWSLPSILVDGRYSDSIFFLIARLVSCHFLAEFLSRFSTELKFVIILNHVANISVSLTLCLILALELFTKVG